MSTETSLTILVVITDSVQRIATKGEEIADRAEAAAEMFQNAAAPVAIGRVLTNIFDAVSKRKDK
jgi:uncharacterized protein YoxC